jgi:CRP/FNR family cyclic AMP-dependent transcriptional regulator
MDGNISLLKKISLFEDFRENQDVLHKIDKLFTERTVRKGQVIFREGNEGAELYIIKKGRVRILKNTLQNESYTVALLSAEQNAFFGEMGLLLNDRRSATVAAEENSVFLFTTRSKFIEFGENEPFAALLVTRRIAQILARRLQKMNKDVVTLFSALVDEIDSGRVE